MTSLQGALPRGASGARMSVMSPRDDVPQGTQESQPSRWGGHSAGSFHLLCTPSWRPRTPQVLCARLIWRFPAALASTSTLCPSWEARRGRFLKNWSSCVFSPSSSPPTHVLWFALFSEVKSSDSDSFLSILQNGSMWHTYRNRYHLLLPFAPAGSFTLTCLALKPTPLSSNATLPAPSEIPWQDLTRPSLGRTPKKSTLIWLMCVIVDRPSTIWKHHLWGLSLGLGETVSCQLQRGFI